MDRNAITIEALEAVGLAIRRMGNTKIETLGFATSASPGTLTYATEKRFLIDALDNSNVAGVVATEEFVAEVESRRPELLLIETETPRCSFWTLHNYLADSTPFYDEEGEPRAVHLTARIAPGAFVEEGVGVGEGTVVEHGAFVHRCVSLGRNVYIGPNCVVGGTGFQIFRDEDGKALSVRHVGGVMIEDEVSLNGLCSVNRAVWGGTRLGARTQCDHLVHVGHNAMLGKDNALAAGAVIAGSVRAGDRNFFGPGCVVTSGAVIGSDCHISLGAVVIGDVKDDETVSGNFAMRHGDFVRSAAALRRMARKRGKA